MAPVKSVLAAALLASAVVATPVAGPPKTISFTKKVNVENLKGLAGRDRARAQSLLRKGSSSPFQDDARASSGSTPVTNEAVSYIASVGVGSPATTYDLIVDTGSSNTWVGAGTKYVKTSTSKSTGSKVSVSYGSGSFSGTEFTDTVALGSGLTITAQSIGVASTSSGFEGVDGILGIGPVDLTEGTLGSSTSTKTIPTVTDNLFSKGLISSDLVAVSFEPPTSDEDTNGELTFGATDSSKFTGSIVFTSITSTSPANLFWGINAAANFGGSSIFSSTAGIVDTGTTLVLIATNAFTKYQSATGATADSATGLLRITSSQLSSLKPLNFVIAGTTFALSANAQIWPRSLNADIGGTSSRIYLITADLGSDLGSGLDFILGQSFLERFYSVFDTGNRRVGLAQTPFTSATTN